MVIGSCRGIVYSGALEKGMGGKFLEVEAEDGAFLPPPHLRCEGIDDSRHGGILRCVFRSHHLVLFIFFSQKSS